MTETQKIFFDSVKDDSVDPNQNPGRFYIYFNIIDSFIETVLYIRGTVLIGKNTLFLGMNVGMSRLDWVSLNSAKLNLGS